MDAKNCEGKLSLSTILPSPPLPDDTRSSELVVRKWIARFATNCSQPLGDGQVLLWLEQFQRVASELLEQAFQAVLCEHVFSNIPTVGEVWEKLDEATRHVEHQRWLTNQPPWEELHRRGQEYCEKASAWSREIAELQSKAKCSAKPNPIVIARPEVLAKNEADKKLILELYR